MNGRETRGGGWLSGLGPRLSGALPNVIEIQRDRGQLQVESRDGTVLRTAVARQARSGNGFILHGTAPNGAAIQEHYSVTDRGQRLIVRTTIAGHRNRQITTVYQRA